MDFQNKYIELVATIKGRKEGYENFLTTCGDSETKTVQDTKAQVEELEKLIGIINKQK
jgi:hypothetical protein